MIMNFLLAIFKWVIKYASMMLDSFLFESSISVKKLLLVQTPNFKLQLNFFYPTYLSAEQE